MGERASGKGIPAGRKLNRSFGACVSALHRIAGWLKGLSLVAGLLVALFSFCPVGLLRLEEGENGAFEISRCRFKSTGFVGAANVGLNRGRIADGAEEGVGGERHKHVFAFFYGDVVLFENPGSRHQRQYRIADPGQLALCCLIHTCAIQQILCAGSSRIPRIHFR